MSKTIDLFNLLNLGLKRTLVYLFGAVLSVAILSIPSIPNNFSIDQLLQFFSIPLICSVLVISDSFRILIEENSFLKALFVGLGLVFFQILLALYVSIIEFTPRVIYLKNEVYGAILQLTLIYLTLIPVGLGINHLLSNKEDF